MRLHAFTIFLCYLTQSFLSQFHKIHVIITRREPQYHQDCKQTTVYVFSQPTAVTVWLGLKFHYFEAIFQCLPFEAPQWVLCSPVLCDIEDYQLQVLNYVTYFNEVIPSVHVITVAF
jgi:hypothetical protein